MCIKEKELKKNITWKNLCQFPKKYSDIILCRMVLPVVLFSFKSLLIESAMASLIYLL